MAEEQKNISMQKTALVQKILSWPKSQQLLEKYNIQYLIDLFDRNRIIEMKRVYPDHNNGLDLMQFIRFFLNFIEHRQQQTLFLSACLIDLYKQISIFNLNVLLIKFTHITDYLCNKVLLQKGSQHDLKNKLLVSTDISIRSKEKLQIISQLQKEPPIIYGKNDRSILKLSKVDIKTDRMRHFGSIKSMNYISSLGKIISLDSLGDHIDVYDINCRLISKIVPSISKVKRDIVILSMFYSKKQKRLGALLKDLQVIFWDESDNFLFEKSFSTGRYCSQLQSNIWFLQHQNLWATSDRSGNFYTWNIQLQQPILHIQLKLKSKINDLCQIPHLDLIAIVQQNLLDQSDFSKFIQNQSRIILYNIKKKCIITQIGVSQSRGGVHTLQFSQSYQVLLASGFQTKINLFEIHPSYFDATLRGRLVGHQSLVTTFVILQNTPIVISADDHQKIKVWDIRNYSCIQTIDFRGKTSFIKMVSMIQAGKLGLIGNRIYLLQFQQKQDIIRGNKLGYQQQCASIIFIEKQPSFDQILVFTKKDLRVYCMNSGKVKYIFSNLLPTEQQICCCKYISSQRKILIGTEKGQIKIFRLQDGNLIGSIQCHQDEISCIYYDIQNKLLVSAGRDSNIIIQKMQNNGNYQFQRIKTLKDNFKKNQINIMQVSVAHGLICVGNINQSIIYVWDYEFGKILGSCNLKLGQISSFTVSQQFCLFIIVDNIGNLIGLKFQVTQHKILFEKAFYFKLQEQRQHFTHVNSYIPKGNQLIYIACATITGKIYQFDISTEKFELKKNKKGNKNFLRQINQTFFNQTRRLNTTFTINIQGINVQPKYIKEAHKEQLTWMGFLYLNSKTLVTAGRDKFFRIWKDDKMICETQINLAYSNIWNIKIDKNKIYSKKLIMALKVTQSIFKRYFQQISVAQASRLRIDRFIKKIITQNQQSNVIKRSDQKQIYKSVKQDIFQRHMCIGTSLKAMQVSKRLRALQKQLVSDHSQIDLQRRKLLEESKQRIDKLQQRQQIVQFFSITQPQIIKSEKQELIQKQLAPFYKKLNNYLGNINKKESEYPIHLSLKSAQNQSLDFKQTSKQNTYTRTKIMKKKHHYNKILYEISNKKLNQSRKLHKENSQETFRKSKLNSSQNSYFVKTRNY